MRIVRSTDRLLQEAGQGDAAILRSFEPKPNHGLDMLYDAAKDLRARLDAKNALHMSEFAPPGTKDIQYQEQLNNEYNKNFAGQPLDPITEHGRKANLLTQKNSMDAAESHQKQTLAGINQLPDYYNKVDLAKDILPNYYIKGEDGKFDFHKIGTEGVKNIDEAMQSGKYIDASKYYEGKVKGMPLQIQENEVLRKSSLSQQIVKTEKGAVFMKPVIKDGKVVGRTPGVSNEMVDYTFNNDPEAKKIALHAYDTHVGDLIAQKKSFGDNRPEAEIRDEIERSENLPKFMKDNIRENLEAQNKVNEKYAEGKQTEENGSGAEKDAAQIGEPQAHTYNFLRARTVTSKDPKTGLESKTTTPFTEFGAAADYKPIALKSGKPVTMKVSPSQVFDYNTGSKNDSKNTDALNVSVEGVAHYPFDKNTNKVDYNAGGVKEGDSPEEIQRKLVDAVAKNHNLEMRPVVVGSYTDNFNTENDENTTDGGANSYTAKKTSKADHRVIIPLTGAMSEKLRVSSNRKDVKEFTQEVNHSPTTELIHQKREELKGKSSGNLSETSQKAVDAFYKQFGRNPTPAEIEKIKAKYH